METMKMPDSHDSGRVAASAPYPLDAGVTLKAAEALGGQQAWTRDQVAYVVALAYWSGARARSLADSAEIEASAAANFAPEPTREQRVALRMAEMERVDELVKLRRKPTWFAVQAGQRTGLMEWDRYGRPVKPRIVPVGEPCDPDVEWPEAVVPGGGTQC